MLEGMVVVQAGSVLSPPALPAVPLPAAEPALGWPAPPPVPAGALTFAPACPPCPAGVGAETPACVELDVPAVALVVPAAALAPLPLLAADPALALIALMPAWPCATGWLARPLPELHAVIPAAIPKIAATPKAEVAPAGRISNLRLAK
jgi:hypothetical protein